MAERRMFSKAIIGSARFLRMPPTSRLLYYDLSMAGDDDGIVEAFSVMRTTGANEDDLKVLASKGFVKVLNDDLVTYITDWNVNNQIRKDRYHASIYAELLVQLGDGNQMATIGQPSDNQMETESSLVKVSLVKDSTGRDRADKPPTRSRFVPPTIDEIKAYCKERQSSVDPEQFFDFYTANGWKQGAGKPIKNWEAAIRTWERRNRPQSSDKNRLRTDADYQDGSGDFFGGGD